MVVRVGMLLRSLQRLASWKAKILPLVGRLTLVQFVLDGIPLYQMQLINFSLRIVIIWISYTKISCKVMMKKKRKVHLVK